MFANINKNNDCISFNLTSQENNLVYDLLQLYINLFDKNKEMIKQRLEHVGYCYLQTFSFPIFNVHNHKYSSHITLCKINNINVELYLVKKLKECTGINVELINLENCKLYI